MTAFIEGYRNDAATSNDADFTGSLPAWLADDGATASRKVHGAHVRGDVTSRTRTLRTEGRTASRPAAGAPRTYRRAARRPNIGGTAAPAHWSVQSSNIADHRSRPVRGPVQGVRRSPGAIAAALGLGVLFGAMMHFSASGAEAPQPEPVAPSYVGTAATAHP